MDWKLYAAVAGVSAIGVSVWLLLKYRDRWVKWFAEYNQKVGAKEERAEANRQASIAKDQAIANAENAKRENSVVPITEAKKKAKRKWFKKDA